MGTALTRRKLLGALAALAAAYSIPGALRGYAVEVTRLNWGLGARILFLADIHAHGGDRDYLVKVASEAKPDIIALGGDTWDSLTRSWGYVESLVKSLRAMARAVVAVLGNHEYGADRRRRIMLRDALRSLEDTGVYVLMDDRVHVAGVMVGGLDWRDDPRDYEEAVRALGDVDVVVVHSPDAFKSVRGRALVLAGHTHGGQVCTPWGSAIVTNSVYGYTSGLYRAGGAAMYVSRGVGEMVPPRLYCSREVVVVE